MQTIQKGILKLDFGDKIDKDVYDQLSKDQQKYFTLMSDGTLALNTDAQTFYETVKKYNLETMFSELSRVNKEYSVKTTADLENQILNRQNSMKTSEAGMFNSQEFSITSFENLKDEEYKGRGNTLQRIGDMYSRLDILDGTNEEVIKLRNTLGDFAEIYKNLDPKELEYERNLGWTDDEILGKYNDFSLSSLEDAIYNLFTEEVEETKINERIIENC